MAICRVRMETATCRTSTGAVNLIGGGQHKGVIRAVAELFNEEEVRKFPVLRVFAKIRS